MAGDVRYALTQLFEKDERAADGSYVNWEQFLQVLNHPLTIKNMKDGLMIGSSSHKHRDDNLVDEKAMVGQADWMVAENADGFCIRDMYIKDGTKVWAILEIWGFRPVGKQIIDHLTRGTVNFKTSIVFSVTDLEAKRMDVTWIFGCDLTTDPNFRSSFIKLLDDYEPGKRY